MHNNKGGTEMYIIDLTTPYAIFVALMITLLFIILGREFKKSLLLLLPLGLFLILILMHTYQSVTLRDEVYKALVFKSLGVDAIMIFLSYISYLWVDDIEAKEKNKKSIDNSLDWFWKKI